VTAGQPPEPEAAPHRPAAAPPAAVLAVDAGNSKTDVALLTASGEVLATARGGGFQPHVGAAAALDALDATVRACAASAGLADGAPLAVHASACLANADLPIEELTFQRDLRRRGWANTVHVGNDTFALLRAGASVPWGVAVVCGAGINCVGIGPDGRQARFPALGRISGDWGGGQGIGEEMLWLAARAEDGRGEPTALTDAVTTFLGTRTVREVTLALHFAELPDERLQDLVPLLFDVAEAGDEVALGVVRRLAEEVTLLTLVALRQLDLLDTPTEVVLGGGILAARQPLLVAELDRRFATRAPKARRIVVTAPPVLGAALLGFDALRERGDPALREISPEALDQRVRAAFAASYGVRDPLG
jgi:N-acetylglucosamine kinase-like BadF-type ATPase